MGSPVADRAKDLFDLTDGLADAAQRDSLHAQLIRFRSLLVFIPATAALRS
jgi:hypothetical protein